MLFYNYSFFSNVLTTYPFISKNKGFLLSLPIVLFAIIALVFTLVSSKWTTKPLLILVLLISSMASYFMDTYHIVIDDTMIRNVLQTDIKESMDLFSLKQVLYFVFLGLFPAYFIYKIPINYGTLNQAMFRKLKQIVILVSIILLLVFIFSKHYTSFAREHKPLRYSVNPSYWFYSVGNYINKTFNSSAVVVTAIGLDAKIEKIKNTLPKLVIMIVGEAVRADHFSLNGYEKETNPKLKETEVVNFSNVYACGTSTAVSVPCMFSIYDRENYSYKKGIRITNLLRVVNVLFLLIFR